MKREHMVLHDPMGRSHTGQILLDDAVHSNL